VLVITKYITITIIDYSVRITLSLRGHYTGEENVMGNSAVLRRLRKTGNEGADVTCCGRLFQTREPATGNARSPMVDRRVRQTMSDAETSSGFEIHRLAQFVSEVGLRRSCPMQTFCTRGQRASNQSASLPSTNAVDAAGEQG